ncbi:MAG: M48 family metallopeptidase [Clostridia bacterium]|nr:M48 family metallopeptidase [Clostridia bacterium]
MSFKLIALIVMTLTLVWNLVLERLRQRSVNNPLPENVADVYDAATYQKWKAYHGETGQLHLLIQLVSFAVEVILILTDAFAAFAGLFPEVQMTRSFAALLLLSLTGVFLLPFEYYSTMVIEEKYGFNRTTKKTFWLDQLKSFLIGLGLMSFIACLLMWVHQALGDWLIVAFAGLMTLFLLFFAFLYPVFSRIFNKFTPLEEGELRQKLTALLEKHGYRVRAIQVMDASRRSTKSNAYFTGFGHMKTIVLYDTLVASMTTEEICAVFAHELGHGLHHDTLRNQALSFLQMLFIAVLAWLVLRTPAVFADFGFDGVNYGFAIYLIMNVAFALFAPLWGLVANAVSRRAEYRADAQAAEEGYTGALISGLKKLSRENLSDLSPDPLLVKLEYSHPTLSQRIAALTGEKKFR